MSSINIHSGKLVEWIMSRFKIEKGWSEKVSAIREKISNAITDMPESEEIKKLLLGTYINYFHCLKILDILKETELSTKNIFGQYSSKRIKDWQEIIKMYEQNKYYLIDCSQILNQLVQFDIPALKKNIEKNAKTINDSIRKEKDYLSTVSEANNNMKVLLQKYDIVTGPGDTVTSDIITQQLKSSVGGLHSILDTLEQDFESMRQPSDVYKRFVLASSPSEDIVCLPLVTYLLEHGNTTVYEWKYNKKPELPLAFAVDEKPVEPCDDEGEISWDCVNVEDEFSVIDFGIEIEGENNSVEAPESEMLTLLENHETREMLLDDLCELSAFFSSCVEETKIRAGSILDSIEHFEERWPDLNVESVESMSANVAGFIDKLSSPPLVHLLMLKTSSGYIGEILSRIEHERSVLNKYRNLGVLLNTRVTEAARDNVALEEQLGTLKYQCGIIKADVEQAVSKAFNDRKVCIVGEICTI